MKYLIILTTFIIGLTIVSLLSTSNQFVMDAATFDNSLLPGSDNVYDIGFDSSPRWKDANFSENLLINGNISISTTTISEKLTVVDGNISQSIFSYTPTIIGATSTGLYPSSIFVSGRYAYVINANSNTLQVFDVSNPSSPKSVGSVGTSAGPDSVYVSGRYAYITITGDETLQIFDISNPSSPKSVGSVGTSAVPLSVFVSGRYAYVTNDPGGDLQIIDVSNPSSPKSVGSVVVGSIPSSVYVSGRYAYVADSNFNTLKIIDISNPSSPQIISSVGTDDWPNSIYVSGRYAYVVNLTSNTLQVFDVSNPSSPKSVGLIGTESEPYSVFVSGDYAFVANVNSNTLQVFDISNPLSPKSVGSVETGSNILGLSPSSLFVSGRYAYMVNDTDNTIKIIDISGLESVSANIHSLEAGNLQVRNDIIAQGQLQITGGINVGTGGIFSAGPIGISIASTTQTDAISAYFQGRVGIATTTPTQKLEVNGGIRIFTGDVKSACNATSTRGTLWFTASSSAPENKDVFEVCAKNSSNVYDWRKIY